MGSHIRRCVLPILVLGCSTAGAVVTTSDVRLAMREAEAISEAIASYYDDGGENLARLHQLVPEYLDSVPSSPWGTPFQYIQITWHTWEIRLPLPSPVCKNVGLLRHGSYLLAVPHIDAWHRSRYVESESRQIRSGLRAE